ncbi:MAG: DinB family protein [Bacteroidetes bacterium]|nr:MAG: DinB family protein [Bacteroidota bacterium]
MTFSSNDLLADLKNKTEELIEIAEKNFSRLSPEVLNKRPAPEKWSIAECLEHLNRYAEYYHDMIDRKMKASSHMAKPKFRSGIFGNYFSNIMEVKNGKMKKMHSPKDKNPIHSEIPEGIVDRFLEQQRKMITLIDRAKSKNLAKVRIPITIAPWLKLKLGDTFRFSVNHNERHVLQAFNALKN